MYFLGTEMHLITFVITCFEIIMLLFQVVYFLERKSDRKRLYYLILLVAFILYNLTSGFLPDKDLPVSITIQNVVAFFFAFGTSMYLPWYYCKAFDLTRLRFFATYGSILFLLIPFALLFVVPYCLTGNLELSRKLTVVIPFLYGLAFIGAVTRAFVFKFREREYSDRIKRELVIAAYLALLSWLALPVIVFFGDFQVLEQSITNAGFLILTIVYVRAMIVQKRLEYTDLVQSEHIQREVIRKNTQRYGLTEREAQVAAMIINGETYKVIGDELQISEKTVSKHVSNIFQKMSVSNKVELMNKIAEPSDSR